MTPPPADPSPWFFAGILIGFPIAFVAIWRFVCWLLSTIGGWGRLAQRFATQQPPSGQCFSSQIGMVGVASYKYVLKICTSPAGLYLDVFPLFRIGHRPLLIPWSEIHNVTSCLSIFVDSVSLEVGSPKIAVLRLPKKIFVGQSVMIDGQPQGSSPLN